MDFEKKQRLLPCGKPNIGSLSLWSHCESPLSTAKDHRLPLALVSPMTDLAMNLSSMSAGWVKVTNRQYNM